MQGRGHLRKDGTEPCTWLVAAVKGSGHNQVWTGDGLITFADVLGRGRAGGDSDGPWLPFTRFLPQGGEVHPAHQLIGDPGEAVPRWLSESHPGLTVTHHVR